MSTDFAELYEKDTVEEAIQKIKEQAEIAETVIACFCNRSKKSSDSELKRYYCCKTINYFRNNG